MKKIFILLMISIFLISMTSAALIDLFTTSKVSVDKSSVNPYIATDANPKYPVIGIADTIFGIPVDTVAQFSLISNTNPCLIYCSAYGKAVLLKDGNIFDKMQFVDKNGKDVSLGFNFTLLQNVTHVQNIVTYTDETNKTIKSNKTITFNTTEFVPSNGTVPAGNYTWRIDTIKDPHQAVDWLPTSFGVQLSDWAWWDSLPGSFQVFNNTTGSHNFTVPTGVTNVDVLVIGGGGSGGSPGGGGGAGGLVENTTYFTTAGQNISVVVGVGGIAPGTTTKGTNGSNSSFGTLVAVGGGGGGEWANANGAVGASGGGGGPGAGAGAANLSNQGHAGGNANTSHGGGGGGANLTGSAGGTLRGQGGNGTLVWLLQTLAGGGAGGTSTTGEPAGLGGNGGGGNGGIRDGVGSDATNLTGGGGGGGGTGGADAQGGNGGSGLVIVRWSITPTVTLIKPSDTSSVLVGYNDFNATITPVGYSLSNATAYIWWSNSTLFTSQTNLSLTGNQATFNITLPESNGWIWNVQGCQGDGNGTNCSLSTSNFTFNTKKAIEHNQSWVTPEMVGASSTFTLIANVSPSYSVTLPRFTYNGTTYTGAFSQSGNQYTMTKTISIPLLTASTNLSFFWNVTLNDGSVFNSTVYNQTVTNFTIDNCAAYTNLLFNFTMFDEESLAKLTSGNVTIDYAFNIYDLGRTTNFLHYNSTSVTNPTAICISTNIAASTNFSLDGTLKYKSNDSFTTYATRYYNFLNYTLANTTMNKSISLYDVNSSISLPFLLTFRDSSLALAPNILVYVKKQYLATNDFKTVEIPLTDTNGQTVLNLIRNEAIYNLIMVNSQGQTIASFSNIRAFCQDFTIGSCAIDLAASSSAQTSYNYSTDTGISYALTYSNSSKLISLAFNSMDSSAKTVRMVVQTQNQFETPTVCNTSVTTTTGTLTCNVSSSLSTNQYFYVDIYAQGKQIGTEVINANPYFTTTGGSFGADGMFFALLVMLFLILMFADDKQILVLAIGIGYIAVIALGLLRGAIIGATSAGIWMLITIVIFIWKLKQEETG